MYPHVEIQWGRAALTWVAGCYQIMPMTSLTLSLSHHVCCGKSRGPCLYMTHTTPGRIAGVKGGGGAASGAVAQ